MTTNLLAHTRPPSLVSPQNSFGPPRSRQYSVHDVTETEIYRPQDVQGADLREDGRTTKRRKIENHSPSSPLRGPSQPQLDVSEQSTCTVTKLWTGSLIPNKQAPAAQDRSEGSRTALPALMPRPWKSNTPIKTTFEDGKCGDRSPPTAPKLSNCGLAGFFPWTGRHPEDILNENAIRHGFSDRTANSTEKELVSGRTPLLSSMKHKSGLHTLTELFSQLLEQRKTQGTVTSSSTSKPPPRVTLTEAKRKQWLVDLANADIPLRRLNRTIPQGIRGQALLDQCLLNSIPINRAVWFAKCVGANEIRTLKRKGTGNNLVTSTESKWLTEWTISLEQFLENTVRRCGQPNWRNEVQYALRLCTKLYQDNLMERDHYLDWLIKCFAAAGPSHVPSWMVLLHVYLRDLARFCKRAKRLAGALLEKVQSFQAMKSELVHPLLRQLQAVVRDLARLQPLCFLLPDRWPSFDSVLRGCFIIAQPKDERLLNRLQKINEQTLGSSRNLFATRATQKQMLLSILDSARSPYNVLQLCEECTTVCDTFDLLVRGLLEWCTTRFRGSPRRLYLVSQMFQRWHLHDFDIGTPLFSFLQQLEQYPGTCYEDLRHLVAELSHSKVFSITGYLQWLISRGGLRRDTFSEAIGTSGLYRSAQLCNDPSQMLTELSLGDCDDHVINLRNVLLSRAGYSTDVETQSVQECKRYLTRFLSVIISPENANGAEEALQTPDFGNLCWTVRSNVSHWLRSHVQSYCRIVTQPANSTGLMDVSLLDVQCFEKIRFVFEAIGDITALKDVVFAVSSLRQEGLLAGCADTVYQHSESLEALGVFEALQERLMLAYVNLRPLKLSMPLLATSLINLCNRSPSRTLSVLLLKRDLIRGDRRTAAAACSPFSDGIAESLQQAGATFLEDFEAILQSEMAMNEETMTQLFSVLVERIDKAQYDQDMEGITFSLCQLLARLRLHRKTDCDQLVRRWVESLIHGNSNRDAWLLSSLVSTECLEFGVLAEAIAHKLRNGGEPLTGLRQCLTTLFELGDEHKPLNSTTYRFRFKRRRYVEEDPLEALQLFESAKAVLNLVIPSPSLLQSTVLNIIPRSEAGAMSEPDAPVDQLAKGLHSLCGDTATPDEADVGGICGAADDFSVPFCRVRLEILALRTKKLSQGNVSEKMAEDFLTLLEKPTVLEGGKSSSLLPENMPDMTCRLREMASAQFFASLPATLQNRSSSSPRLSVDASYDAASRSLDIIFAAAAKQADPLLPVCGQIIEKLNMLLRSLALPSNTANLASNIQGPTSAPVTSSAPVSGPRTWDAPRPESTSTALRFFPLLLQMICLQRAQFVGPAIASQAASKQSQREHIQLVVLLVAIALHPAMQSSHDPEVQDLVTFTLDTAATLVDTLPTESLTLCARILKDKMKDPRAVFLFGTVASHGSAMAQDLGGGLQMVKEGKGVVGDWKVNPWSVLEGAKEGESWVGLGMFGVRELGK